MDNPLTMLSSSPLQKPSKMGFPSLSALESIGRIDAGEMYAVKIMDVRNSSDAPQPHIWRDEMGTIQAWILSSTALPGSGGYFFLGYGSGHGRSFFILFWRVIWTEVTFQRTCPNLIQFVERAPSSAQDSRLDSEILRRRWRHLGVTPFPPCHRQGSEKRSSTAERSFRAPQCGCSATWPLIICLLWLLWDGHQKLPSIQRDFHACFGSSMAGCDKVLPPFMICVLCETCRVFDHSSKAYAVSKIPVSPATEA